MITKKLTLFLCIYMLTPLYLSSAPLDKYYIPQSAQAEGYYSKNKKAQDSRDIDIEFMKQVQKLSASEKQELKEQLRSKLNNAVSTENYAAAKYYKHLLEILNTLQ